MFFAEPRAARYYQARNTGASKLAQEIAEIAAELLDPIRGGR